jgi:outer membrane biosynthesis protein TonB
MRESRAPALIASVALHALVLGAGLITLPLWSKPIELSASVPVTIVSHAPPEAPTAELQATEPTPPATPEPAPVPQPAPPQPAPPKPAPAKPTPALPQPAPPPPKPAPTPPPTPKKAEAKPVDLGALAASLPPPKPGKARPNAKPVDLAALAATLPKGAGAKGAPRPAAAPVVNPGPPRPLTGDELGAVTAKLMRLWNPNCVAEAGANVVVVVGFHLQPDGSLAPGSASVLNQALVDAKGPVAQAAAQRALTAVARGSPYNELPRDRYAQWRDFKVNFNAKQACALE